MIETRLSLSLLLVALIGLAACKQTSVSAPQPAVPPQRETSAQPETSAPMSATPPAAPAAAPQKSPAPPLGPIQFTDVTAQAGIHFKHNTGAFGKKYLPETMGSGVCILDYDNDGWQDILLINSMDWPGHA